jgi:hypothetical protein
MDQEAPMTESAWSALEATLRELYALPHNRASLGGRGTSEDTAVRRKLAEIRSGISGNLTREDFRGPKLFLRVVGRANRAYGGEWWFDATLLGGLERAYARIFFSERELRPALRHMLRELLAVSTEWNRIDEVWALRLPAGAAITGFSGSGSPQKLFANLPLSAKGNRMLVGRARQVFFPVKNPLWVTRIRDLREHGKRLPR